MNIRKTDVYIDWSAEYLICELRNYFQRRVSMNDVKWITDYSVNNYYKRIRAWKELDNFVFITTLLIKPNLIITKAQKECYFFHCSGSQKIMGQNAFSCDLSNSTSRD